MAHRTSCRLPVALALLLVTALALSGSSAEPQDDHGNEPTPFAATLISTDTVLQGRIDFPGDVDCFMFTAVAGVRYTFETGRLTGDLDTLLILFDRNSKTVLAIDDDGGTDGGSQITWTPTTGGLYFICVRNTIATRGTGGYTLTVTSGAGPPSPETGTDTPPTPNPPSEETPPEEEPQPPAPTPTPPERPSLPTEVERTGRIALLGADDEASLNDVRGYLMDTGAFTAVEVMDTSQATPTAAQLDAFEAVLVWADSGFRDADALGDLLADYVDRGGGVVVAAVSFDPPDAFDDPDTLGGRFLSGGYYVIKPEVDNTACCRRTLGDAQMGHPIMQGITKIDGGPRSYHSPTSALTPGGSTVASWDNGDVLVAVKTIGSTRRADVNLFPPSSRVDPDLWPFTQDNDVPQLFANALMWVAGRI